MQINKIDNLTGDSNEFHFGNHWNNEEKSIRICHVHSLHAFNRILGYARYINSTSGTVLYRGQNELYDHLLPSGAREKKIPISEKIFSDICKDQPISKFFGLNRKDTAGWIEYNYMLVEATLQHYGANTYCMDFVDNHWCALWFGLYKFENNHYHIRQDYESLYVFLYVAETEGPCINGMYIGEKTYTVDLRKALPSTFQRPASQHGWIVRHKERTPENLDKGVVGIIEISVKDAKEWLGKGKLVSEENFFPSYAIDQGYRVLLSRQHKSGLFCGKKAILPQNTICNYHTQEMIYCSDGEKLFKMHGNKLSLNEFNIRNPIDLFYRLLNVGWDKSTCTKNYDWNEEKPYIGQSAPTAILFQKWFGGTICLASFHKKVHYFNIINGILVDLTKNELQKEQQKICYKSSSYKLISSNGKIYQKHKEKVAQLIENCKRIV